jgi:exodeoxyribonuclease V gamma subunit
MALRIYTSNRLEELVESLAETVREPLSSPLERETIVVQSRGMERWLSQELARRFGVWAACDYPFPSAMVGRIFRAFLPEQPERPDDSPWAPEPLTWRLFGLLPRLAELPAFAPIRRYLIVDPDGLKRFQLAGRIADTFDQYTIYRPELLLAWERGEGGDDWQPRLWRELRNVIREPHRARLLAAFRTAAAVGARAPAGLPARLSLFGIPTLPPFHLEVFARLAIVRDVHLFLLNPCQEYWGRIVSESEQARLERRLPAPAGAANEYLEQGNPLLASCGRIGRDFLEQLLAVDAPLEQVERFVAPADDSLLAHLQGDILELRDRPVDAAGAIDPADRSLTVHACHTPLREVEVLRDTLLDLFANDPSLTPRDILVMTPDIEAYAPCLAAVFGAPESPETSIPFTIADRSLRREGETVPAFLALLALVGCRTVATRVLDLLESGPVARRFGLSPRELETVRQWVRGSGIRWGIDASERAGEGVPPFAEGSWRFGLDRLLLGYALEGGGTRTFAGIVPYDDLAGSDADLLGRFLAFAEGLFAALRELTRPRSLAAWSERLRELLDAFLAPAETEERDLLTVRRTLDRLAESAAMGEYAGPVGIESVRAWLAERLGRAERGFGFLTGGVTCCALLPMRSIPFRVVALLGMNDGAFPRSNPPPGFSRIAREPRPGDRSLRDEDRYLFLEALLSARQRLHLSYLGQSVRDNTELPPSVLVSELLDYVGRGYRLAGGDGRELVKRIEVKHRLQPFAVDYFRGEGPLFSYSRENAAGVRARLAGRQAPSPFVTEPLPAVGVEGEPVQLADLADFLANPARHFLKRRLGVILAEAAAPLADSEPIVPDRLELYHLDQEIVGALLAGLDPAAHAALLRGQGLLPPGSWGEELYRERAEEARELVAAAAPLLAGGPLPAVEVDLELPAGRLLGRVERLYPAGAVRFRMAKVKVRDRLRAWLDTLALAAAGPAAHPGTATLLGTDVQVVFSPPAAPRAVLNDLLGLYRRGLAAPLPFFPAAGYELVRRLADPKKAEGAWDFSRKEWLGNDFAFGEAADPAVRRCFPEDPLDRTFADLAQVVFAPLLAGQQQTTRKKR